LGKQPSFKRRHASPLEKWIQNVFGGCKSCWHSRQSLRLSLVYLKPNGVTVLYNFLRFNYSFKQGRAFQTRIPDQEGA
jgi:hypothetical protein